MSQLILVLADLYPAVFSDAVRASLPRLAQLELWLARGAREQASGGWRRYLQQLTGNSALRQVPPASIGAAALSEVPDAGSVWFATPVHLVAGLDTVRLHPSGVLMLSAEEQRSLEADFARVFAGSGYALRATGRRELLLTGLALSAADEPTGHDPSAWLGHDPRAGMVSGRSMAPLRRLGTEIEMWLHEHPVNQVRQSRGALNVSALWLWGGGAAPLEGAASNSQEAVPAAVAFADDLFMDGLAKLGCVALQPLASRRAVPVAHSGSSAMQITVCALATEAGAFALERVENEWIAPAFRDWQSGALQRITLVAGDLAVSLGRAPLRRFWRAVGRTPPPWWESWPPC